MNVNDPLFAALLILMAGGVYLWWLYLAGAALAIFAMVRGRGAVQDAGLPALLAQFAPLVAGLLLFFTALASFALDQMPPAWLTMGIVVPSLAIGPFQTLWLVWRMWRGRGAKHSAPKSPAGEGP